MSEERCRHAVVYIEAYCRAHDAPPPPAEAVPLRPLSSLNGKGSFFGTGAVTQVLPQVRVNGSYVGKVEAPEVETPRHRDAEDEGIDMKDLTLGALIGAAGAIFVVGLLLIFLIR